MSSSKQQESIYLAQEDVDLLVNGYSRCGLSQNIPDAIIDLLIRWYMRSSDEWDVEAALGCFKFAGGRVKYKPMGMAMDYQTIFGMIRISQKTKRKIWKILCAKHIPHGRFGFCVGLTKINTVFGYDAKPEYNYDAFYGRLNHSIAVSNDKTSIPKVNDVITFTYETLTDNENNSYGKISVKINDATNVIMSKEIPINDNQIYKLAVSFCSEEAIELLE